MIDTVWIYHFCSLYKLAKVELENWFALVIPRFAKD